MAEARGGQSVEMARKGPSAGPKRRRSLPRVHKANCGGPRLGKAIRMPGATDWAFAAPGFRKIPRVRPLTNRISIPVLPKDAAFAHPQNRGERREK